MSLNYHSPALRRRVVTFVDEVVVPSPVSSAGSYRPPTSYRPGSTPNNDSYQPSNSKSIKRQFIFKDPDEPSVTSSRIADEEISELNKELGKAGVVIEVQQLGEIKKSNSNKKLDYLKMSFDDLDFDVSDRVSYLNLAKEPEIPKLSAKQKKPEDRRRMYDRLVNFLKV